MEVAPIVKLMRISLPTMARREFRVAALDGSGELLADPGDPQSARQLVSHLVQREADGWFDQLPVSIFDRLCAAIFQEEFSAIIESRSKCTACAEPFSFQFSSAELIAAQDTAAAALEITSDADGYWQIASGFSLRPPTLADVDEGLDPERLAKSLIRSGNPSNAQIETLLDQAAPLLTMPVGASCPHCGQSQEFSFDMAGYLVSSIAAEHAFLVRETHLLASRYGWTHESIMALPRSDRRSYATLIESERSAALDRRSA